MGNVTHCEMGAFCGKDEDARALAMENPRAKIIDAEPKKDTAAAAPAPAPAPAAAPPRRQSVKKTSMREGKAKASTVKESNISEVSHESSKTGSTGGTRTRGETRTASNQEKVMSCMKSIVAVDADDPVFEASSKAKKAFDFNDETHIIVGKVMDFVCGAPSPPAPEPVDYMVRTLAETMVTFQDQMAKELRMAGTEEGEEKLVKPDMAGMWEMERFYPSSENVELRVLKLRMLAVCRETGVGCMAKLNVFVEGDRSSGFTLDSAALVDSKYISTELGELAQERYQCRRMGIAFGSDLFEGDYDLRTPIHIAASEGDLEGCLFLLKMADGNLEKISPKDRWGGTPLGDAERGLIKMTAGGEEKKSDDNEGDSLLQYAEVVKIFKEAGAESDSRGVFDTIDIALNESPDAVEIIEAAASGDIGNMRTYSSNSSLYCCDYDSRTAMHLAASNGHLNIIKFLLGRMDSHEFVRKVRAKTEQCLDKGLVELETKIAKAKRKLEIINYQDRFYGTPMMDAERGGAVPGVNKAAFDACHKELKKWNDKFEAEIEKHKAAVVVLAKEIEESRTKMGEDGEEPAQEEDDDPDIEEIEAAANNAAINPDAA